MPSLSTSRVPAPNSAAGHMFGRSKGRLNHSMLLGLMARIWALAGMLETLEDELMIGASESDWLDRSLTLSNERTASGLKGI